MTQITHSTMGAPLTEAETARIHDSWAKLYHHALGVPAAPHPVDMLEWITDSIMLCYEIRVAISDGWYYANKRAFPTPTPRPKASPTADIARVLEDLGDDLSNDEITKALQTIKGLIK